MEMAAGAWGPARMGALSAVTLLAGIAGGPGAWGKGAPLPTLFAEKWIDGTLAQEPAAQVQALDADTFVIRQSVKTNFEAPFLYLLFGRDRALLIDTGAGGLRVRPTVDRLIVCLLYTSPSPRDS